MEEVDALADLFEDLSRDLGLRGGELKRVEELLGLCDGERRDFADVFVVDEDSAGFSAETLTSAVGAEGVATIFGEKDADVEFVFFALEGGEESSDAGEPASAVFDEALLLGCEIVPGDVSGYACGFGGAEHFAVVRAVLGRGPWSDGSLCEGLGAIGD